MSKVNLSVPELATLIKCYIGGYSFQNYEVEVRELVDKDLIEPKNDGTLINLRVYQPTKLGQVHVRQLCCLANPIKKSFWIDQNGKEIDYLFEDKITEE